MISILGRTIYIKSQIQIKAKDNLYQELFQTLISLRNITEEELDVKLKNIPSFELLTNIENAVDRLIKAVKSKERIILFGDYDVDGVTSTTIMYDFLKRLGANVVPVLPNRVSGYGLSKDLVDLFSKYSSLVLTLDNGTTATEEINYAKQKYDMDFIVLDHHRISNNEDAPFLVNPNISEKPDLKGVCTAGLSFYMVGALRKALQESGVPVDIDIRTYLDLVAIGTIADVMPITYLNRTLVSKGLELINKINNMSWEEASKIGKAGIKALINYISRMEPITTKDIGFKIAPMINAAGRIRKPVIAMKLLSEKNYQRARYLAEDLNKINQDRKKISNGMFKEAYELALNTEEDFIVLGKEDWHHGVLGIVAGRLSHKLKKPTGIFYINKTHAVGSVRSVEGLDVHSLLSNLSYMFDKWGGHAGAAGVTIKKDYFEAFKKNINELLKKESFKVDKVLEVDMELPLRYICKSNGTDKNLLDKNVLNIINKLSPYGELNPEPVFISEEITVNLILNRGMRIRCTDQSNAIVELNCFEEDLSSKLSLGQCIKAIYNIDSYGINLIDAININ